MKKMYHLLASLVFLAAPATVLAHPGHGETEGFSVIHYFTEPVHAVVTILAIAAVITLVGYARRRQSRDKKA
jgi:hydrogenase/urease accessory protein HupE